MKRRDLLKGGVAALAGGATVVSAPAIAAQRVEITMVATWDLPIHPLVLSLKLIKLIWILLNQRR
ncbi:hypothetical protein MnTg03_01341 [bacterium MnTg03]|nr:hypothetical protein MnTg03_01341 [bacterium MnTg03]